MNLAESIDVEFPWEKDHGIFALKENTLCFTCFYLDPYVKDLNSTIEKIYNELIEYEFQPWLDHYVWSTSIPRIEIRHDHGQSYIVGCLEFGENLLEETLVTWFLYNFSSRYQDLYIHIFDNEGEFLLIELADHIPLFLDTNNGLNRPWINNQQLVVIPNDYYSDKSLSLKQSLTYLEQMNFKLQKDPELDVAFKEYLKLYPQAILKNIFTVKVEVPSEIASVLCNNHISLPSMSIQESLATPPQHIEPAHETNSVSLKIKVPALCYLNLIKNDILEDSLKIGFHILRGLAMLRDLGYNIKQGISPNEEAIYNYEQDSLQEELQKRLKISEIVKSEFEFDNIPDQKDDIEEEKLINRLKEVFQSSSSFKGMDKDDIYNDDSDYSSDSDNENIKRYFAEEKVDIDEDDFFEFFCKEALKLQDEDIAQFKATDTDNTDTVKRSLSEDESDDDSGGHDDEADLEFDQDTIRNLLQALKMGQGSGPLNTLFGDL